MVYYYRVSVMTVGHLAKLNIVLSMEGVSDRGIYYNIYLLVFISTS